MGVVKTFHQDLRTEKEADDIFFTYCSATRRKAAEECVPYHMDIEINNRCTGGCRFCFNSSNPTGDMFIPKEKLFQLIEEGYQLGARQILWNGGEPLFHPDFFERMFTPPFFCKSLIIHVLSVVEGLKLGVFFAINVVTNICIILLLYIVTNKDNMIYNCRYAYRGEQISIQDR